eukprot:tig00021680_g23034.t1
MQRSDSPSAAGDPRWNEERSTLDVSATGLEQWPAERIARIGPERILCLRLAHNRLRDLRSPSSGAAGLYWVANLTELDVSHNQLQAIPEEIRRLVHLEVLLAHGNQLASLPPELGRLASLRALRVDANRLEWLPVELGGLPLDPARCSFAGNPLSRLPEAARASTAALLEYLCARAHGPLFASGAFDRGATPAAAAGPPQPLPPLPAPAPPRPTSAGGHSSDAPASASAPAVALPSPSQALALVPSRPADAAAAAADRERSPELHMPRASLSAWPAAATARAGAAASLVSLNLSHNRLPALPPAIGELTNLRLLDLSHNSIAVLPPRIGQLRALYVLDLAHNRIDSVPAPLGDCAQLRELRLEGNVLQSLPKDLAKLSSLTYLNVADNRLWQIGAQTVPRLGSIRRLDVSGNQLRTLPRELAMLPHSVGPDGVPSPDFVLLPNPLDGVPPEARASSRALFTHLRSLCGLPALAPAAPSTKPSRKAERDPPAGAGGAGAGAGGSGVVSLDFSRKGLEAWPELEASLARVRPECVRALLLADNRLATLPESAFAGLAGLQEIDLSRNRLVALPASLFALPQLRALRAPANRLASLPPVEGAASLAALCLDDNLLDSLPAALGTLPKLQAALSSFAGNPLRWIPASARGESRALLGYLRSMAKAKAEKPAASRAEPPPAPPPPAVAPGPEQQQRQRLAGRWRPARAAWELEEAGLAEWPGALLLLNGGVDPKHVRGLLLSRNSIPSVPGPDLARFSGLETLCLDDNLLTALPESIGDLSGLVELVLSRNALAALPASLARLVRLERLALDSNRLASLPAELPASLAYLALDDNRLEALPPALAALPRLLVFSCTGNPLGSLPPEARASGDAVLAHLRSSAAAAAAAAAAAVTEEAGLAPETAAPAAGERAEAQQTEAATRAAPVHVIEAETGGAPPAVDVSVAVDVAPPPAPASPGATGSSRRLSWGDEWSWDAASGALDASWRGLAVWPSSAFEEAGPAGVAAAHLAGNALLSLDGVDFASYPGLRLLDLSDNLLEALPESLGRLSNLRSLSVARNRLSLAGLPAALGGLAELDPAQCDFSGNPLEAELEEGAAESLSGAGAGVAGLLLGRLRARWAEQGAAAAAAAPPPGPDDVDDGLGAARGGGAAVHDVCRAQRSDADGWGGGGGGGAEGAGAEKAPRPDGDAGLRVIVDAARLRALPAEALGPLARELHEALWRVSERRLAAAAAARGPECPLCFDAAGRHERSCLQPCGHTVCEPCGRAVFDARGAATCPACRAPLAGISPLLYWAAPVGPAPRVDEAALDALSPEALAALEAALASAAALVASLRAAAAAAAAACAPPQAAPAAPRFCCPRCGRAGPRSPAAVACLQPCGHVVCGACGPAVLDGEGACPACACLLDALSPVFE